MNTLDQITTELVGYNPHNMSADSVTSFLTQLVQPVTEVQQLSLCQALGRVLAADIISPISVPPHNNSAMDGYAFDGSQLRPGEGLSLKIVGSVLAGQAWTGKVQAGECLQIMTGAMMPPGLDTVVPQELVTRTDTHICLPPHTVRPGDHCRLMGEDLQQGQPALHKGELLTPAAIGLVASLGLQSVPVYRRLKVATLSTGNEILSLGEPPRPGAVYDSNRYTLFGLLTRLGCEVIDLGVVRDEPAALQAAFEQAASQADAIITSGGVSVGEADHTKQTMAQLGEVAFWRVAMRPGRPLAVGRIFKDKLTSSPFTKRADSYENKSCPTDSAILFGLPGNPVAAMVSFLAFVRPALLRLMGCQAEAPPLLQAHASEIIPKKPGRTEYQRGIVSTAADGTLQVRTTGNQGSGVLSSMAHANGLIVLSHDQGTVQAGELVKVMMFDGVM
ncbi:gephyrin-like molybdotransferase Glp [Rhodoferax fermentans]|uniref:Molybdopterin molybdenumtransferase n=1 Tax=Rhodoferax fermentans TaxID=28066 RepID=A0A1T1AN14_RHOFE|nr:gephyrin-like molybdotransferase Glp [Rhodoferax fermentans]MBK1684010.1 molybdopterin molybdenumtransferase MoeA [Rhodoferax fermentans]OOV05427.1 molybdopterin molybdenumtransferase MoeA [Rhodoferax fermentans]